MTGIACALIALSLAVFAPALEQKSENRQHRSNATPRGSKWSENKFDVRVERPYVSQSGHLVLVYTVTNKTGEDLRITRNPSGVVSLSDAESVSVLLKLKKPDSYTEVSEESSFLTFGDKFLPADIPVTLEVFVRLSEKSKPSDFSRESEQQKVRTIIDKELGNTESIALLLPKKHLKINLPIPRVF